MADQSTPVLSQKGTNVGIGIASPLDKLHVVGGILSTSLAVPSNTSVGSLQVGYDGTNGIIRTWNSSPLITSTYNYQAFETSGSERMRITSGGSVGIGTSTPNQKLHVRDGRLEIEATHAGYGQLWIVSNGAGNECSMTFFVNGYNI